MEPLRIYIDTSVLGGCFDVEFAEWSKGLIGDFRAGRLMPVLLDMTAAEVVDAPAQGSRAAPGDVGARRCGSGDHAAGR